MTIDALFTYVLKSTRGVSHKSVTVMDTGFLHDRSVVVTNGKGKVFTGREHPTLTQITSSIEGNNILVDHPVQGRAAFKLPEPSNARPIKLFRNTVEGIPFGGAADDWISHYLDGEYRLMHIGNNFNNVLPKRGGRESELKTFTDSAPVHLINRKTLEYLNLISSAKVGSRNFRPNIVINGDTPFEEDSWSEITIGACRFRVQEKTSRCIFVTVDPKTATLNKGMEPLTSLAQVRLKMGKRPTFGIGLVPINQGKLRIGDTLTVDRTHNNET